MKDEQKAKKLIENFMKELKEKFKINFIYVIAGSLAKGKYKHGKSDIDLMILSKRGNLSPYDFIHMYKLGKKYGQVFKKGRMIPIFDIMIFFNTTGQKNAKKAIIELIKKKNIDVHYT